MHARFRTKIVSELYEQDKKKVTASSVALTAAGCTTESYVTAHYITVEWKMRWLVHSATPPVLCNTPVTTDNANPISKYMTFTTRGNSNDDRILS